MSTPNTLVPLLDQEPVQASTPELSLYTSSRRVGITEASQVLGITREAIRQRIRRGQLDAVKIDGTWSILLDGPPLGSTSPLHMGEPNHSAVQVPVPPSIGEYNRLLDQLEAENRFLRQECAQLHDLIRVEQENRRQENEHHQQQVSELHILLQRAQAQIPMPAAAATPPQDSTPAEPERSSQKTPRRRWWWPFASTL